jgi:gas vesicle protein
MKTTNSSSPFSFLAGAGFGLGVGVVLGLLTAPRSGKSTRRRINRRVNEGIDRVTDAGEEMLEKGEEMLADGKEFAESAIRRAKEVRFAMPVSR